MANIRKAKKRINITADAEVEKLLTRSAKRDNIPVTSKAAELLRLALELEEDVALASLAEKRLLKKERFVSHEKAWQ